MLKGRVDDVMGKMGKVINDESGKGGKDAREEPTPHGNL
jgi:hypothetical protein